MASSGASSITRVITGVMTLGDVQHGVVVIPKSCTPSRIQENFVDAGWKLSESEMKAIDTLDRAQRFCSPKWMDISNWG